MHHSLSALAIGAFAYKAMAQTASFDGMTWGPVTVGQVWPIHWTVGTGDPVSLVFGNTTSNSAVFTAQPASPSTYNWTVTLPDGFVPGNYGLVLVQGTGMDYSPLFSVSAASAGSSTTSTLTSAADSTSTSMTTTMMTTPMATANATLISASADPTVTVTYWDQECGCTKTSAVPAAATATGNASGTQYTWWDETCGCTKTAMAPAPTLAPGCGGTGHGCSNYTAPATGTNMPPAPPPPSPAGSNAPATGSTSAKPYTGQASRLMDSGFAVAGFVVAAVALVA
ncbi:hypothetical protein HRR83_009240 [Exophiala dermatitidis]|uniref:Uncharacterized protein n=1 Tax=Exophiala dermatitidis TaxID=5970 RepID=A0AAN6IPG4_EXODE|nr:hypothetical protein HRR75_008648 [Exophiala dermatitidis]KAJ4502527.1 hypothetical protein HRR73_009395 [Exophiala dermatitidis]KAJ4503014.1 hypothetical protein HRR74_009403 [Exophiala dermatitidis]KAJ4531628.1 hypothetical protein HRR77_009280 [Exophiala dermatitidis]KAJ4548038.1 hypothetical protein HRR76_000656 [Exophiala dermatitidis]